MDIEQSAGLAFFTDSRKGDAQWIQIIALPMPGADHRNVRYPTGKKGE
jgi:hypothetical protein